MAAWFVHAHIRGALRCSRNELKVGEAWIDFAEGALALISSTSCIKVNKVPCRPIMIYLL